MDYTIVDFYGPQKSRCGYCKGTQCSVGDGMHAYVMAPRDYQDLIDRGWRRSGHYCYKQDNTKTCCPHYTIKCDVSEFKLSKSHKKIIKRMNRFLRDGKRDKNEEGQSTPQTTNGTENGDRDEDSNAAMGCGIREEVQAPNVPIKDINLEQFAKANGEKDSEEKSAKEKTPSVDVQKPIKKSAEDDDTPNNSRKSDSDITKPPCKKAKQMRLERKLAKQAAKGLPAVIEKKPPRNQEKTLKEFLNEAKPDDKHKLKIVLVPSSSSIYTATTFDLYCKYQLTIHNDNPERLEPKKLQRFLYNTPLKFEMIHVRSEEFEKTLPQTYSLYAKYQTHIHNDPPNAVQEYLDFLQRSPLKLSKPSDGPPLGYGSFHQQYYLDDKLIAVAVIDILPYCVSSVYFFYDPDYNFLSLGTYSSLREIELVQELSKTVPDLKYYYMGFYIHSCQKMRYKGKLSGSYLLCPEAYTWHPLSDEIRLKLDANKYQRFNDDPSARDPNEFKESDMDLVRLLIDESTYVKYRQYKQVGFAASATDKAAILKYGQLVGKPLAHRMLYVKM
ncbi:arginyl-tRNA--protein transferase 1-like [Musca vetustissima]|uniref:arginyl-tRNA--protein transferase 1-like n=1 Tax=Musca vetustissima TaxID=27455 RepID=UPI002AB6D46B|nr:arginyl-tRNA--protein transferase 1-like [Musca vetustissima]